MGLLGGVKPSEVAGWTPEKVRAHVASLGKALEKWESAFVDYAVDGKMFLELTADEDAEGRTVLDTKGQLKLDCVPDWSKAIRYGACLCVDNFALPYSKAKRTLTGAGKYVMR